MPGKNIVRLDIENGYYHVYNRGVEKRIIFQDSQDYGVYLSYLKDYLSFKSEKEIRKSIDRPGLQPPERDRLWKWLRMNNFYGAITLMAYCLMPDHFHFFIKQSHPGAIDQFMNSLSTRYVMYFNRKYKRVGPLYQSRYKAVLITSEDQYLHISRYIHKQALAIHGTDDTDQPSSLPDYLGTRKTEWIHPEEILSFFSRSNPALGYERFVAEYETAQDED